MADSLKVFQNTTATPTASSSALSIPVLTTGAGESANIKDIQLKKQSLTEDDIGFYKYPTVLKVDGNAITNPVDLTSATSASVPLELTGSQIVDSNSSVTLEIAAEAGLIDYGKAQLFYSSEVDSNNLVSSFYNHAGTNPADADSSSVAAKIEENETLSSGDYNNSSGRNGTIRESNGVLKRFIADNNGRLIILDTDGNTLTSYGWACWGIAVDDTYVYGTTTSNNNQLLRWNHVTNAAASTLTTTRNHFFANSNPGFMDYYDGFVYIKPQGNYGDIEKINVSDGSGTWISSPSQFNQAEFLGGVITVNDNGVPMIVMHADTNCGAITLESTPRNWISTSTFPSNPTTTYGCGVVCIGNGLVLVDNASYSQVMIMDLNSILPNAAGGSVVQTLVTNQLELRSNSDRLLIGSEFKEAPTAKTRNLDYQLFSAGVLTTP